MKRMIQYTLIVGLGLTSASAQVGQFEKAEDIGEPAVNGSSVYDQSSQTYTLKGGGENIWFNHDEFHFLYKEISGDFLLTANFQLIGNEDGNGHRKTGWMIRENTDHDAVSINSCLHGDGLVVLQWRLMRGAYMRDPEDEIFFPKQYFGEAIIQLERMGKTITMRMAHPGEPLEEMGSVTMPELNDDVLIGLYSLAHDLEDTQEARIWNVRMSTPVAPDWHPNPQVETISHDSLNMGSRLETVDVSTRQRKVVYESAAQISSPSFGRNGQEVKFAKGGDSFSVSLTGGEPKASSVALPANKPESDGQFIYYSDNESGTSQIWKKRANGSDPRQLTHDSDHAWFPHVSPDGNSLVYLALPHDANPEAPDGYQRVALKLLPLAGGGAKTIAHFYGGKGSLDSSCWSSDSSQIVFVSH